VPGGGRVHQAGRLSRLPLLELALHVLPGGRGELGAELDAGDPEPAPGQRPGGLARRAPHLHQVVAGLQAGQRDEIVEQRLGIIWPHPVILFRGLVERLP
jgi:hypothetical protein